MYIDRILYQKTFNIGSYMSEKIGVELTLNEGENAEQALDTAKSLVEEYHKKNNPINEEFMGTKIRDIVEDAPKDPKQALIQSIQQCKELEGADGLLSFKRLSENDAEIKAVYDLQLLKLKK